MVSIRPEVVRLSAAQKRLATVPVSASLAIIIRVRSLSARKVGAAGSGNDAGFTQDDGTVSGTEVKSMLPLESRMIRTEGVETG